MDTTQKQVDDIGDGEAQERKKTGGNKDKVLNGILRRIGGSSRGEVVNDGKRFPFYPEEVLDVENLDVPEDNQDEE